MEAIAVGDEWQFTFMAAPVEYITVMVTAVAPDEVRFTAETLDSTWRTNFRELRMAPDEYLGFKHRYAGQKVWPEYRSN